VLEFFFGKVLADLMHVQLTKLDFVWSWLSVKHNGAWSTDARCCRNSFIS